MSILFLGEVIETSWTIKKNEQTFRENVRQAETARVFLVSYCCSLLILRIFLAPMPSIKKLITAEMTEISKAMCGFWQRMCSWKREKSPLQNSAAICADEKYQASPHKAAGNKIKESITRVKPVFIFSPKFVD